MRNNEILAVLDDSENEDTVSKDNSKAIALINDIYAQRITDAARAYGDDGILASDGKRREEELEKNYFVFAVIAGICTCAIIAAIGVATKVVMRKKHETPITSFDQNQQVVIGNPVSPTNDVVGSGVTTGAPVTVSAPMKGASESPKELS